MHPTSRQEAEGAGRGSLILCVGNFAAGQRLKTTMPILMDQVLTEYARQACEGACLRRNDADRGRDLVLAETLTDFEASGAAMRFVSKGGIAWKATPKLRQYLKDLELDAQGDLENI